MSQHYILVQLKVKAEATKRLYAMLCTAYKTKNVMYQQSIQNGVLAFPLLFLLMLVGCDTPSTIEEIGMEQNTAFESEKAISDLQGFANKVTLVKFIDPIAEVPDRENIAKLVIENGCVSVQLESSNSIYTAIFQSNTHLMTEGKTLSGISTSGIHVSLNEVFRFNGAIAADIKKLPEVSNIPQSCKSMFHTIGDISQ